MKHLHGVSGWLGLLTYSLLIIPVMSGMGIYGQFRAAKDSASAEMLALPMWTQYERLSWLIFAIFAFVSINAGYRLLKVHRKESVTIALISLWLIFLGSEAVVTIMSGYVIGWGALAQDPSYYPGVIGSMITRTIGAALWSAYLLKSERVRNTYV